MRNLRGRLLAGAVAWLALPMAGIPEAAAACRRECSGGVICDHLSGGQRWDCLRGPSRETCRTVCTDSHGAIAWSPETGAWGFSYDHDSRGRAERFAIGRCARRATDCRIVTAFLNNCGALAVHGKTLATRTGESRREAEAASLAACRAAAGTDCTIAAWACNSR